MEKLEFKLLLADQITREILNILNVLTDTTQLDLEKASYIINNQLLNDHYTYVGYLKNKPVCMGSYVILNKLGRNGCRSVLIEDVAVALPYQKQGFGKQLIQFMIESIKKQPIKVHKIFLDCSDKNIEFYEKCGMYKAANQMRIDL